MSLLICGLICAFVGGAIGYMCGPKDSEIHHVYHPPSTDIQLAPVDRVWGNMWKADYFTMFNEVRAANKGIARLRHRNEILEKRLRDLAIPTEPKP